MRVRLSECMQARSYGGLNCGWWMVYGWLQLDTIVIIIISNWLFRLYMRLLFPETIPFHHKGTQKMKEKWKKTREKLSEKKSFPKRGKTRQSGMISPYLYGRQCVYWWVSDRIYWIRYEVGYSLLYFFFFFSFLLVNHRKFT